MNIEFIDLFIATLLISPFAPRCYLCLLLEEKEKQMVYALYTFVVCAKCGDIYDRVFISSIFAICQPFIFDIVELLSTSFPSIYLHTLSNLAS